MERAGVEPAEPGCRVRPASDAPPHKTIPTEGEEEMVSPPDTKKKSWYDTPIPDADSGQRDRVPLRLPGSQTAIIELPQLMTEDAWAQMMLILEALKPGYVATSRPGQVKQTSPTNRDDPK